MKGLKTVYICTECAYKTPKWLGKCPNCGAWNSFAEDVEEVTPGAATAAAAPAQGPQRDPRPGQGGGVGRQQGVGLISFPWEGNEIRGLDACQGRRTVKGQGQLKARFGRPDLRS